MCVALLLCLCRVISLTSIQVNRMCSSLTDQVRSIANVTTAVAKGDLTQKIEILVEGEMSTLKGTVNSMVDQLSAFASEVTRVALEVGTQGILGGQAKVEGVQGTWADLTRNVNVRCLCLSWPSLTPLTRFLSTHVHRKWPPISQTKYVVYRK